MKHVNAELLLPAGNFEKLKYAFAYGADAVYAGVPRYSLRTRENDFRRASLIEAMAYSRETGFIANNNNHTELRDFLCKFTKQNDVYEDFEPKF
jgi:putative protease